MKVKVFWAFVASAILVTCYTLYPHELAKEHGADKYIYVSPAGDDRNPGTKSQPLRTLQQASREATAGATVLVRSGVYHEGLHVKHSGTAAKPITFKNYKNEKVVISGKNQKEPEEETALIHVMDKDYITIQGFTIEDLSTSVADATVMGIYVSGTGSHIKIKGNHVRRIETKAEDGNAHGIAVYGTGEMKDIQISDNTIEKLKLGFSESLVLNGDIDGFIIANNIVRQNDNIGIDLIGHEGTAAQNDYVRNGIVEHNIVYNNSSYGNPSYGDDYSAGGIYVDGGSDITIRKNKVHHNDIGIEATSEHKGKYAKEIRITGNEVYDNAFTGISIGGYDDRRGGTMNSTISHNTIYHNDTKGLDGGQLLFQQDTKKNRIEHNILTASDSRLFLVNDSGLNRGNRLTQNVYHREEGKAGIWIWEGKEFRDFSAYRKSTGHDVDSEYRILQ
ncbi:nitrous oxide reductase family maturation protein NosD [Kroppenstedtia eburnea]|uniref:right-handed parallel beta-helix repeat-containing protein n=1 Tax=Kroppenstedtia eburnea TaxID=714067 RepID=UPI003638EE88